MIYISVLTFESGSLKMTANMIDVSLHKLVKGSLKNDEIKRVLFPYVYRWSTFPQSCISNLPLSSVFFLI